MKESNKSIRELTLNLNGDIHYFWALPKDITIYGRLILYVDYIEDKYGNVIKGKSDKPQFMMKATRLDNNILVPCKIGFYSQKSISIFQEAYVMEIKRNAVRKCIQDSGDRFGLHWVY